MLCHAAGVKGEAASGSNREGESTDAERRGGAARSGVEGPVMGLERRGCVVRPWPLANWKWEEILCRRGGGTVSVLTPPPKA